MLMHERVSTPKERSLCCLPLNEPRASQNASKASQALSLSDLSARQADSALSAPVLRGTEQEGQVDKHFKGTSLA